MYSRIMHLSDRTTLDPKWLRSAGKAGRAPEEGYSSPEDYLPTEEEKAAQALSQQQADAQAEALLRATAH